MLPTSRPFDGMLTMSVPHPQGEDHRMAAHNPHGNSRRRQVMAAMVLGTALSALSVPPALGQSVAEPGNRVVADISRYCTACWRNARLPADCWSDCTQDVFSRLMQRLQTAHWDRVFQMEGYERQESMRAIDAVKKRTQRHLKRSRFINDVIPDLRAQSDGQRADEREVVDQAATEVLSPRQQRILQMSFEGWAVQDIATELTMPPERVSDEKYKAIKKLREHLQIG
jgi:RNA polymerase sigma factor (sigma-70 family)